MVLLCINVFHLSNVFFFIRHLLWPYNGKIYLLSIVSGSHILPLCSQIIQNNFLLLLLFTSVDYQSAGASARGAEVSSEVLSSYLNTTHTVTESRVPCLPVKISLLKLLPTD